MQASAEYLKTHPEIFFQEKENLPLDIGFSGTLREHDDEGNVRIQFQVQQGLLIGWAQWYYPSGQLQAKREYQEGKVRQAILYYESGQQKAIYSTTPDGKKIRREWDEAGMLIKE